MLCAPVFLREGFVVFLQPTETAEKQQRHDPGEQRLAGQSGEKRAVSRAEPDGERQDNESGAEMRRHGGQSIGAGHQPTTTTARGTRLPKCNHAATRPAPHPMIKHAAAKQRINLVMCVGLGETLWL